MRRLNAALDGRYRIERALGAGGMATVYLARDLRHDRDVAIKVLRPDVAETVGERLHMRTVLEGSVRRANTCRRWYWRRSRRRWARTRRPSRIAAKRCGGVSRPS